MNQSAIIIFSLATLLAGCQQKVPMDASTGSVAATNPKDQHPLAPQPRLPSSNPPTNRNPDPAPSPTPTTRPAVDPSASPSPSATPPSVNPSPSPSATPTAQPSVDPSPSPSATPTAQPSVDPSPSPSASLGPAPTAGPAAPTVTSPASSPVTNGTTSLTIAGTCINGNIVKLDGDDKQFKECGSNAYSFTVTKDAYSTFDFQVTQVNTSGATSTPVIVQWVRTKPIDVPETCATPQSANTSARAKVTMIYKSLPQNASTADKTLASLDVYGLNITNGNVPAGAKCLGYPVVVYVHSGLWKSGDKLTGVAPKVSLFNKNGFVFVSVNHRLSKTGVAHPAHMRDLRDAIAWVQANIQTFGGDPHRISLMGHESGGHMVSLASISRFADPKATDNFSLSDESRKGIQCTVSIDSDDYDLVRAARSGSTTQKGAIWDAFGSVDGAIWRDVSPQGLLMAAVVEKRNLETPRFLVITEQSGRNRDRYQRALDFYAVLWANGDHSHQMFDAGNISTAAVDDAIKGNPTTGVPTTEVARKVLGFLKTCYGMPQ